MSIKVEDTKKSTEIRVIDTRTGEVTKVVYLQDIQIGLTSNPKDLDVTGLVNVRQDVSVSGSLRVSGIFTASNASLFTSSSVFLGGITGSLQRTSSGLSFLVGSPFISVTTASNDQVLIASTGADMFSIARMAAGAGVTAAAGSFTIGHQFTVTKTCSLQGVRFYWSTPSKTIKFKAWSNAGADIGSSTVDVTSAGVYEAFFTASILLVPNTLYRVSCWQNDAANYTRITPKANLFLPSQPFYAGNCIVINSASYYGTGDAFPNTSAATEFYPLEPLLGEFKGP